MPNGTMALYYFFSPSSFHQFMAFMKKVYVDLINVKGAFNNYVDQILTNFDPLPPSSGQAWTLLPSCKLGHGGHGDLVANFFISETKRDFVLV